MSDMKQQRVKWLGFVKQVFSSAVERDSLLGDLCPSYRRSDKDTVKTMRKILKLGESIKASVLSLIDMEDGFGCKAVLGRRPSVTEAFALSLIMAARIDVAADRQVRQVQDIAGLVSCRDPETALEVRCLFRADGSLSALVNFHGIGRSLDERTIRLKESVLNRILALGPDSRNEALSDVELTGRL